MEHSVRTYQSADTPAKERRRYCVQSMRETLGTVAGWRGNVLLGPYRLRSWAYRWAIGVGGSAQCAGRQCHNGNRISHHIEELDAVAGFPPRDIVPFHNGTHIACTYAFGRDIAEQYNILVAWEVCHTHLAFLVRIEGNQARGLPSLVDLPDGSDSQGYAKRCPKCHTDFIAHSVLG